MTYGLPAYDDEAIAKAYASGDVIRFEQLLHLRGVHDARDYSERIAVAEERMAYAIEELARVLGAFQR